MNFNSDDIKNKCEFLIDCPFKAIDLRFLQVKEQTDLCITCKQVKNKNNLEHN